MHLIYSFGTFKESEFKVSKLDLIHVIKENIIFCEFIFFRLYFMYLW